MKYRLQALEDRMNRVEKDIAMIRRIAIYVAGLMSVQFTGNFVPLFGTP